MAVLTTDQRARLIRAADALLLDAAPVRIEDFVAQTLAMNVAQRAALFPAPDPTGKLALVVAEFTEHREHLLRDLGEIPSFVVTKDTIGRYEVCGLKTHLLRAGADRRLIDRLPHHAEVRRALMNLQRGHFLESVAAAIIKERCGNGTATRGSGDQGIDALVGIN